MAGGLDDVMRSDMKLNYLSPGPEKAAILDLSMDMALTVGPQVFANQSRALRDWLALRTHNADHRPQGPFFSLGSAVNGWCTTPCSVMAKIVGRAGFDMVTVDLQHGLIDYQIALMMCQVLQGLPAPVLARVTWNEPGIIMKCPDADFSGVICPMINRRIRALCFASRALLRANPDKYGSSCRLLRRFTNALSRALVDVRETMAQTDSSYRVGRRQPAGDFACIDRAWRRSTFRPYLPLVTPAARLRRGSHDGPDLTSRPAPHT
jgi:hypothetical protein